MAQLKFGNFEIKAEMPEMVKMIEVAEVAPTPQPVEVDLSQLYKEIEVLKTELFEKVQEKDPDVAALQLLVNDHVFMIIELHERLSKIESRPIIEIPEVKHITHVKDVGMDVLNMCNKWMTKSESNTLIMIEKLEIRNRKQKKLNYILSGGLVLLMLLYLL